MDAAKPPPAEPAKRGPSSDHAVSRSGTRTVAAAELETLNAASLKLAGALAAASAIDPSRLRDLAMACDELGDAFRAHGRHPDAMQAFEVSLKIAERLAESGRGDIECQRDLSLSLDHLGDVLLRLRRYNGALERYNDSLLISARLAAVDPANAEKQRDLSISLENCGDVLLVLGRRRDAISVLGEARQIREELVRAEPGNSRFQADLAVNLSKLAAAGVEPRAHLTRALELLSALGEAGQLEAAEAGWIHAVRSALAECGEVATPEIQALPAAETAKAAAPSFNVRFAPSAAAAAEVSRPVLMPPRPATVPQRSASMA